MKTQTLRSIPLVFLWTLVCWALNATAQAEQPNVVVILVDDAALMDFGAFGGEAETPTIDALAREGVVFTHHRASPFCAPSRAMLLTGMDNHLAGVGTITEVLPPYHRDQPGYMMTLEPGVKTLADYFKQAGYRTYMTGKWHLGHDEGELPNHHGFDRSFVMDASGADHWEKKPYIPIYKTAPWFEDGEPAELPDDFYSSTFIAQRMTEYLQADAQRDEPFFAYVAFMAVHLPVQAPREYTQKYIETYSGGWEEVRQQRWQRAGELGLIPAGAPLAAKPNALRDWDELNQDEQAFAAKSMAVNAGMLDIMDVELGKLIEYLKSTGNYDNTIFVVTSDNGPEAGGPRGLGSWSWFALQGYTQNYDDLGEKRSYGVIGPEWASAAAGPSHLFKFHAADGGLRVPLMMAGPGLPTGSRVDGFTIMADVAPTLLELVGVSPMLPDAKPMTGRSLIPLIQGDADAVYEQDDAIGFETSGKAALFLGQYKLVRNLPPHGDDIWRLYNIETDPGESTDLSEQLPEIKRKLMHEYRLYANRVGVLELRDDYEVRRQIARNSVEKLVGFYWGWLLFGALIFGMICFGVAKKIRSAIRRRGETIHEKDSFQRIKAT